MWVIIHVSWGCLFSNEGFQSLKPKYLPGSALCNVKLSLNSSHIQSDLNPLTWLVSQKTIKTLNAGDVSH